MRRYWIPREFIGEDKVRIEGEFFRHICTVCRAEIGERFEVMTEGSRLYLVELKSIGKKCAWATLVESRKIVALPFPHINLALSVSRFQTMDLIIEKAVEMGVSRVWPFYSERSFTKDPKIIEKRTPRWTKVVQSATQQCGRGELMQVMKLRSLSEILTEFNQSEGSMGLFAYEGVSAFGIKEGLRCRREAQPEKVWIFIGSEGGFTVDEVKAFERASLLPLTLGPQVLRVETACLALVSVIKYEFDLMH